MPLIKLVYWNSIELTMDVIFVGLSVDSYFLLYKFV